MRTFYKILFLTIVLNNLIFPDIRAQNTLSFKSGLKDWIQFGERGAITLEKTETSNTISIAKLGKDYAGIATRVNVDQFSIVSCNLWVKTENENLKARSFIRFYDDTNHLLLELANKSIHSDIFIKSGFYTLAPANSRYLIFGIDKDSTVKGYIYAKNFVVHVDDSKLKNKPTCNLKQYMKPFWDTDTVFNETILLYADAKDTVPQGKLLFHPKKILSVTNYSLDTTYRQGVDYTIENKIIKMNTNSIMPYSRETDFSKKNNNYYNINHKWIDITYTCDKNEWIGYKPEYKGDLLPQTIYKLKTKRPLKIAALGMSITRGLDASGFDNVKPYMPSYCDLFVRQLKIDFQYNKIHLYNASLPGASSDWAAKYAEKYINPLHPDLVIIDMGMNDFWSLTIEEFKKNIQTAMNKIRADNPNVEFLLISNMLFDPEYFTDGTANKHLNLLRGYRDVLGSMEGKGVVNLDMTSVSEVLYNLKKAKDCISNPLHPNDYMIRWYAQGLIAMFVNK